MNRLHQKNTLAIAMWDFSWLERRWPGAGYENWEQALGELQERGYDAVRIDCYPHLLAEDPDGAWELLPEWSVQLWGAPLISRVGEIRRHLIQFMKLCKKRRLLVALSTWFREDRRNVRMNINSPERLGALWVNVLETLERADVLDIVYFVDLCNEFALDRWAPFLPKAAEGARVPRASEEGTRWMREAIAAVRERYPDIPYCFSITNEFETYREQDVSFMDVLELHLWMAQKAWTDFYERVGYHFERFDETGYTNLSLKGEALYRADPERWKDGLRKAIATAADWSRRSGKPLITTEGWGVVDYKDGPLLRWDWVKELCEFGVAEALRTGRWIALCTSNFCGPQFVGMWRDIAWHRRLTDMIHRAVPRVGAPSAAE